MVYRGAWSWFKRRYKNKNKKKKLRLSEGKLSVYIILFLFSWSKGLLLMVCFNKDLIGNPWEPLFHILLIY